MRGHLDGPGSRGGFDGMRGGVPAERLLRNAEELKLTDDQVDKLEKLSYDSKKTLVDLHAEIEKAELEIQNLLRSGNDDIAAFKVHIAAVSQARADIQTARIANLFEARKVLTEKQKKAIKEEFPRLGTLLD
jgi:Spy/CpxP family protein refolding chaperone